MESDARALRKKAEKLALEKLEFMRNEELDLSVDEMKRLIHELRVHQIELEMQNDELRRTREELDVLRENYFKLYNFAPLGYCNISKKGIILEANQTVSSLLSTKREIMSNQSIYQFILNEDKDIFYFHLKHIFETDQQQNCELRLLRKDGESIWVRMTSTAFLNSSGETICNTMISDIADIKRAELLIIHKSFHDELTGLHNRRFFNEEIERLNQEIYLPLSIVLIDVNGLKLINDAFGHKAGDVLLEKVAKVLKIETRTDDISARIGGDEFILLLPKSDSQHAENIVKRINKEISREMINQLHISIAVGIAVKETIDESIENVYKIAENEMYRNKLLTSSSMRNDAIGFIMHTLYEKSAREMNHSKRVSEISEKIAKKMNLTNEEIITVKKAGLMHDIGKIGLDINILNKTGSLDFEEWGEIRRHPEIGFRILSSANSYSIIADVVLSHHEKWDGSGYPRGLKADEITKFARIIAVADAFDAMTGERSYGKKLSIKEAIEEIIKFSGSQFDPEIVNAFIKIQQKNLTNKTI
ncbi:MAG: HD domain-containing phosphohydrolase [Bacillota bacterium]